MKLIKVIPKVFYSDIRAGLDLFERTLGFTVTYSEPEGPSRLFIIERDGVQLHLVEDDEYAKKDRPEIRIDTNDIETLYSEVAARPTKLLHPNLARIKSQPWGLKEFALLDTSGVCVIIQQKNPDEQ